MLLIQIKKEVQSKFGEGEIQRSIPKMKEPYAAFLIDWPFKSVNQAQEKNDGHLNLNELFALSS
jgi:hypothetical protein